MNKRQKWTAEKVHEAFKALRGKLGREPTIAELDRSCNEILGTEFFARDSREVAHDLVGKLLMRDYEGNRVSGIISEVDAFAMQDAIRGKKNEGAFRAPGVIHMYPVQGKYMLAISTDRENVYSEVLVRKVVPLQGVETMRKLRGTKNDEMLTNGPGKVVQAFGIDREFDEYAIDDAATGLWIVPHLESARVKAGKGGSSEDFVGRYALVL